MMSFKRMLLALALVVGCDKTEQETSVDPTIPTTVSDDGTVHDDLSMPAEPTLDPADFKSAQECVSCHPTHVEQWQSSAHAYAMVDPVYRVLVMQRQIDLGATEDQFCTQCHSSVGTRGGECVSGFSFEELSPIVQEGVTCESCHKISSVERMYNAGHTLDPTGPLRGGIEDPIDNAFHESAYSGDHKTSELCGSCHDVVETSGLELERPYEEWTTSPAALDGQVCQDCHMPAYDGQASVGGPERTLHEHRWVGVDLPATEAFLADTEAVEAGRARIQELLEGSATLSLSADPAPPGEVVDLHVTLSNEIGAHNFPTGTTFIRQAWVEVIVSDAAGNVVYETGTLDANGDLRDHWSEVEPYGDKDLISLSSGFIDAYGNPEIFPWRATEHWLNALSPGYERTYTLFVPTSPDTVGPLQVVSRLRFRAFPPYLIRIVGLEGPVAEEKLHIYDLEDASMSVELR
jgi:hypothetical protein